MTIQLGPDPNRSALQRHNEMFPHRYGLQGPAEEAKKERTRQEERNDGSLEQGEEGQSVGAIATFYSLLMAACGLVSGLAATYALYMLTRPESFSAAWLLAYVAIFVASACAGALIAYMARYVILAGLLILIAVYAFRGLSAIG